MTTNNNTQTNREVKFRGIRKDLGNIVYYLSLEQLIRGFVRLDFDDYFWSRFTGLKDKNGKEIYEGDIVEVTIVHYDEPDAPDDYTYTCIVRFYPTTGYYGKAIKSYNGTTGEIKTSNLIHKKLRLTKNRTKVIGNIYENPELLKEEK